MFQISDTYVVRGAVCLTECDHKVSVGHTGSGGAWWWQERKKEEGVGR